MRSGFALSGKRFPMGDKKHQRLAIGGATRAERAGNISASTANRLRAEARHKLGIKGGGHAGAVKREIARSHGHRG